MKASKVTQADIAAALRISRNTVSKVLNLTPGVADETRRLVLDKARELGYPYVPAPVEPLAPPCEAPGGACMEIAFLGHSDSFDIPYWSSIIKGIEESLSQNNVVLRFVLVSSEQEAALSLPPMLLLPGLKGIIMAGYFSADYYRMVVSTDIPLVTYDMAVELAGYRKPCDIVTLENAAAVAHLTSALVARGHTRLAFGGDPRSCLSFAERYRGFRQAMAAAGLTPCEVPLLERLSPNPYCTAEELKQALSQLDTPPTAFVCASDVLAQMVAKLKYLPEETYRDIAICGFDNSCSLPFQSPLFGTVDYRQQDIGSLLARQILARIRHPDTPYCAVRMDVTPLIHEAPGSC